MTEVWNSSAATLTNQVNNDIPDFKENFTFLANRFGYLIDPTEANQGVEGSGGTIYHYVNAADANRKYTLFFPHYADDQDTTTYTLSTTEVISAEFTLVFQNGARIADDGSNASLTINGQIVAAPNQQIFDWGNGTGTLSIDSSNSVSVGNFGTNAAAFQEALDCGAYEIIIESDITIASTVTYPATRNIHGNSRERTITFSGTGACFEPANYSKP